MSDDSFVEVDVSSWAPEGIEQLGTKPKLWLIEPESGQPWLFKQTTSNRRADGTRYLKGDDWAERVVAAVAFELGVPAAATELAVVDSGDEITHGIISRKVLSEDEILIHGNELLAEIGVIARSPKDRTGYTLDAVRMVLERVDPPVRTGSFTAWEWFVGYLVLDALVSNTDRHQENWTVIETGGGRRLAPSFDHASSLGFQLDDADRAERLLTRDRNRTVDRYASRASSKFEGEPHPCDVALEALGTVTSEVREHWLDRCGMLASIEAIVNRVPTRRMSAVAKEFASALVEVNRSRLLSHPTGTLRS